MDNWELIRKISLVPTGLIVLATLSGLLKRKELGVYQKRLFLLMNIALVSELVARYFWMQSTSNFPVYHVYSLLEYSVLASIYSRAFKSVSMNKVIELSVYFIWVFGVVNAMAWQPLKNPNSNVTSLTSSIFIIVSIYLFVRILQETRYSRIEKSALFWINIGVLIFFSSSFVLFTFGDWLDELSLKYSFSVWVLNIFFNTIHYLCFNIALWMKPE